MSQTRIEPKVIASAAGTLVVGVVLAVLVAVSDNPTVLGALPAWLQFLIITIIPPVVSFLSGYLKTSTTSTVSEGFNAPKKIS